MLLLRREVVIYAHTLWLNKIFWRQFASQIVNCHIMRKTFLCHMQTTKAQISLRSLISTFVVRCLDSIIPILAKYKILRLASVCSWAGRFESYLVANPEDRFSNGEAQFWTYSSFYWKKCQIQKSKSFPRDGCLNISGCLNHDMTKPAKWVCAQRRLISAWASAQSDQSLRCPHEETLGP